MAGLIVLPQYDIDVINEVQDYILGHPGVSVGDIKMKYNLTEAEYQMIFDLCMPSIRKRNTERYWIGRYKIVLSVMEELYNQAKNSLEGCATSRDIKKALNKCKIGKQNSKFYEMFAEYKEDEEDDDGEISD